MKEQVIGLATLSLVLSSMVLRASLKIIATMVVIWLIGRGFPIVAEAIGIPQRTLFGFITSLLDPLLFFMRYH